jgi:MFS family permease
VSSPVNPFLEAPARKKTITLIGIYAAVVCALIQSTGLSTLLPLAAEDVGQTELYPLASTLGGAVSVITMPLYGWLAAKYPASKRTVLFASLIVGAAVCFVRGIAPNMMTIIVASLFWAFTSAGIFVVSFSMVREMFEGEKVGTMLGLIGTMMSVGTLGGPVLTGLIIDNFGWRMACHFLWPFLLVAAGLIYFLGVKVPGSAVKHMAQDRPFDIPGCIGFALFLGGFILCLSLGASSQGEAFVPFGGLGSYLLIAVAIVGLVLFLVTVKRKGDASMLPVSVLKNRNTMLLACINTALTASAMALFFFLPAYVRYVMGGSATEASLTTTIFGVVGLFLGPVLGKMIAKARNARGVITMGTIVRIACTLAFILLLSAKTSIWLVFIIMFIAGVYNIQNTTTNSTAPQVQIPEKQRVQGNAVVQLGQNAGSSIGMAVYTLFIAMLGVEHGLPAALWVALGLAVVGLVLAQFLRPLAEEKAAPAPAEAGR